MDYLQMTAPCGLDCFNCAFYLAPENPDARTQIEQWSILIGIQNHNTYSKEILS